MNIDNDPRPGGDTDMKPSSGADNVLVVNKAVTDMKPPPASPATHTKTKIKRLTWDEVLSPHLENEFREWIKELKDIIGYKVERYIFGKK